MVFVLDFGNVVPNKVLSKMIDTHRRLLDAAREQLQLFYKVFSVATVVISIIDALNYALDYGHTMLLVVLLNRKQSEWDKAKRTNRNCT